ncbi:FAD-binding oxidoreductase [Streptomyces sp. AK02-01A]|uniref:FAD-binding oxidoreductase n=1 Tax=Streptomyces sp. AK02-01A TaxID=3028648 RepID=UPI0029AB2E47|nr:FAD-binding oxidoreductase [Streptomyces sp. AK02-01A]MDX3853145.1 FAD-binding oxidoreductase [Streptomyces sp. AK02-01A]
MLSDASTAVVRDTLPLVESALGEISKRFYDRLFAAHPGLLRNLFNRGNQAVGSQQQALAGAFASFAGTLVHNPDQRPDVLLSRIANKHASLGISPGQYPVVHEHLTAAIGEVLGDPFTAEVAAVWSDVYWLMANSLIRIEQRLYAQHGVLVGSTWRPWTVTARTQETDDVTSFALTPADHAGAPAFRPGQYVSVQVQLPDGANQIRQYSLSRAAGEDDTRHITVKRVHGRGNPDGEVSNHLHEHLHEGDTLNVSAPYGDLVIKDTTAPLLLASAGIGCTPMLAMLEQLAVQGHRGAVTVVHGDRTAAEHALRTQQKNLTGRLADGRTHFWYERPHGADPEDLTGLVDISRISLPDNVHAYLCGPLPFMRTVRTQLLARGVSPAHIHYEVFGPDLWLGTEDRSPDQGGQVEPDHPVQREDGAGHHQNQPSHRKTVLVSAPEDL